jgi:hypothetical protein
LCVTYDELKHPRNAHSGASIAPLASGTPTRARRNHAAGSVRTGCQPSGCPMKHLTCPSSPPDPSKPHPAHSSAAKVKLQKSDAVRSPQRQPAGRQAPDLACRKCSARLVVLSARNPLDCAQPRQQQHPHQGASLLNAGAARGGWCPARCCRAVNRQVKGLMAGVGCDSSGPILHTPRLRRATPTRVTPLLLPRCCCAHTHARPRSHQRAQLPAPGRDQHTGRHAQQSAGDAAVSGAPVRQHVRRPAQPAAQ